MMTYEFTLRFALCDADGDPERHLDRLAEAGCDDAAVGIGQKGRIALEFSREARSASQAILGALRDVRKAIPGARLLEATPDFVGLTDVARLLGCTRQNVRKLMIRHASDFPAPVHEGNPVLWRLSKVLTWAHSRGLAIDEPLLEVARATHQVNLARELQDAIPSIQERARALIS